MMMFPTLSELFLYLPDLPRDTSESKRESEDPPSLTTRWGGGGQGCCSSPHSSGEEKEALGSQLLAPRCIKQMPEPGLDFRLLMTKSTSLNFDLGISPSLNPAPAGVCQSGVV